MIIIENLFRQDILKAIEDWDTRAKLMNKEDFDSPGHYKAWLDDIRISKNLASIEYWKKKLNSKNEKDFDSIEDYSEWLGECIRNISLYIVLMKV